MTMYLLIMEGSYCSFWLWIKGPNVWDVEWKLHEGRTEPILNFSACRARTYGGGWGVAEDIFICPMNECIWDSSLSLWKKAVPFPFTSTWITDMSLCPEKLVLAHSWIFVPLNPSFIFIHLALTEQVIKKAKEEFWGKTGLLRCFWEGSWVGLSVCSAPTCTVVGAGDKKIRVCILAPQSTWFMRQLCRNLISEGMCKA